MLLFVGCIESDIQFLSITFVVNYKLKKFKLEFQTNNKHEGFKPYVLARNNRGIFMHIAIYIVLGIIILYILLMFVFSLLFIPHLGWKRKLDESLPKDVSEKMIKIGKSSKTKMEVLERVVDFMLQRVHSKFKQVIPQFGLLFEKSFNKLWEKGGFVHCHQHNLILRYLLLGTKRFSDEDIKLRITHCHANIHQYSKINVSENKKEKEWISVDTYAVSQGFKIGETLPKFVYREMKKRGLKPRN